MAQPKGIRWPEDLEKEIEQARIEDCRGAFSDEVIYLAKLGLQERKDQRAAIERDRRLRGKSSTTDASADHPVALRDPARQDAPFDKHTLGERTEENEGREAK